MPGEVSVFAKHEEFARLLASRGHELAGGQELMPSHTTRTVTKGDDGKVVTDGPYAETVEQLGAFYLVESDDLEDLLEICGVLAEPDGAIEVRTAVDHSDNAGD
ncbi:YciI family protein [Amycolatopsis sp. QT-25]|uniref:YciI family protein n=1 Tax=Amycolatopsis sp. QT-25 TaxID=3034022 RepID=UPI0023EDBF23|nr:YciI family protein [Amycolatopsis sp. QT-25]WET77363.1 YciI family protein [Amycolatopsis sp. QT-25]